MARAPRLVAISLLVASCAIGPVERQDLGVANGTTLVVRVSVNDSLVGDVDSHRQWIIPGEALPPLPWIVQARSPSGRVLLSLSVPAGSVSRTTGSNGETVLHGSADRVDLNCGRLDLYVGPPLAGPAPGPGVPGDCDP